MMTEPIETGPHSCTEPGRIGTASVAALIGRSLVTLAAAALVVSCGVVAGQSDKEDSIHIKYVGSPAGVYDAVCDPVTEAPPGRIVELEAVADENIIDATYEYLPDGLQIVDSTAAPRFADCRDYRLEPAATVPTSTDATVPDLGQTTISAVPTTTAA
jgi:hypothetical protein